MNDICYTEPEKKLAFHGRTEASVAGFSEIIGQEHIKNHFQRAAGLKKAGHAYIIDGEKGTGKKIIAKAAAMVLQCERQDGTACGVCRSCRQIMSGNQPDVRVLTHEKPGTISVEEVRDQLVSDIAIKPYGSPYKIYIIEDGEKMTVQAQNAILKTVEEPPSYGVIFLLTDHRESFLPTILSRCIVLKVRPLKEEQIRAYLMEKMKVTDYQAEEAAMFAGGNLGKAMAMANGDEFRHFKESLTSIAKKLPRMEDWEAAGIAKDIAEYRERTEEWLDLMVLWFRDVLCVKAGGKPSRLHFSEEKKKIYEQADAMSFCGLERIFTEIESERARLKANVNPELGLDFLLTQIHAAFVGIPEQAAAGAAAGD